MDENFKESDKEKEINKKARTWVIVLIVFAILFAVGSIIGIENSDNLVGTTTTSTYELELSNISMTCEYNEYLGYSVSIKGSARNTTRKNLSYAQIEFAVYDANGNNLGTALANINNLMAGDNWQFEATLFDFPSTKPASYKLVDVTTW